MNTEAGPTEYIMGSGCVFCDLDYKPDSDGIHRHKEAFACPRLARLGATVEEIITDKKVHDQMHIASTNSFVGYSILYDAMKKLRQLLGLER